MKTNQRILHMRGLQVLLSSVLMAALTVACAQPQPPVAGRDPLATAWEPMNVVDLPPADKRTYYVTYMDRSTLEKMGELRRVYLLTNYVVERALRIERDGIAVWQRYRSDKALVYVDCKEKKFATADEKFFSGEMAAGELVHSIDRSEAREDLDWESRDVDNFIRSRVDVICSL